MYKLAAIKGDNIEALKKITPSIKGDTVDFTAYEMYADTKAATNGFTEEYPGAEESDSLLHEYLQRIGYFKKDDEPTPQQSVPLQEQQQNKKQQLEIAIRGLERVLAKTSGDKKTQVEIAIRGLKRVLSKEL